MDHHPFHLYYDWPGNVGQLENVVQRALAVSDGSKIAVSELPHELPAVRARAGHGVELEALT